MKQEIHFARQHGKQTQSGNEIWPVYVILENKNFIKTLYKKSGLKLVTGTSVFLTNQV